MRKPALGHDWGDWIVDQQETDQADGLKHRICKTCGERQDAKIPKLEHIHNHLPTKVEPTCEEQGYTRYTCACGDTYIEQSSYVPALGHIWVETAPAAADRKDRRRHHLHLPALRQAAL